ncbi:UxaA family hydrolase [Alicyclobacillus dauci]|uniref:UxaA family hydrolase n=1 Tax=Alicyclobacillus dauci TaxID=1475485 RepID=A0ABY6YXV1_9BACL|nr:UxaA family hydrolase [Alicyclobacillus dauci]WAH35242.1 UxaA family hydrolase [Alicyclobacillus dauci]
MNVHWILQKNVDDVATALKRLPAGTKVTHANPDFDIVLRQDIPFAHKFAVRDIPAGTDVHKYGQVIGRATQAISAGDHVHVHNLESLRGRGDLQGGETGDVKRSSLSPK